MARSKRIEFLAECTKGYDTVLDIGTDHGFVLEQAFKKGYIKKGIASDLRPMPLNAARENLKDFPVDYVISDGFQSINEPFDLAIIAGMGAYLICEIMEHAPKGNQTYLLQANDKIEVLRTYLMEHEFKIIDEYIIHDRFYYVILKVIRGHMDLSEEDLLLGHILRTKKEALSYYKKKASQIEKIITNVDPQRAEILKKMLKVYKNP